MCAVRILVVEDDPTVATALERGLQAEGFDVDRAEDGDTGYWLATEHHYGAIVLDVMLPKRNGFRVCADLRGVGVETPILMLTAKDGIYDEAEGLDAGADDYLAKPFSFVVLTARIRALLRRPGKRRTAVQVVGVLEIDVEARVCRCDGAEITLTHREFALLEVFARQPGVVCSKDFLLGQVWGPEFEGSRNVVEVYVGYLRRKFDDAAAAGHVIETVHGHGYKLVA